MPSSLKDFYLNEVMRNDVKAYLIDYLKVCIIDEAFKPPYALRRDDNLRALGASKEVLDKAFDNLDILFAPKSEGREQPSPR